MQARVMRGSLSAFLAFFLLFSSYCFAADKPDCKDTKKVQVSGTTVLENDLEYRATRQELLESLLVEAATLVNGAEITTRRTVQTTVTDDESTKKRSKYDAIKARGVVDSYSFPMDAEYVSESSLGMMLNLTVDVVVCDQSGIDPPIYIAIEDIILKKFEEAEGESLSYVVAGAMPADSSLRYVRDEEMSPYRDFVISGQILSVAATAERSRLRESINTVVRINGEQPFREERIVRLSAIIQLMAYNVAQDSYALISETIEDRIPWPGNDEALSQKVDEFIGAALNEASIELYRKIIKNEGFKRVRKP